MLARLDCANQGSRSVVLGFGVAAGSVFVAERVFDSYKQSDII